MAIRWSRLGNKFGEFNLPPDYAELTADGKRAARVNAVACRETPQDAITAWHFFRNYYLNWEEAYFYKEYTPSAPFHYDLVGFFRDPRFRCHAVAAPRGYSKSTVIGVEQPLIEIVSPSKPAFELALVLAKDTFVEERFDTLMVQLEENGRIVEDFGRLRPEIGAGVWNRHHLRLKNRVKVKGYSVEGKKRGARPDLIIIDDPEDDPKENTDQEIVLADMDNMLVRQILGMMLPSSRLLWIGTLLNQRAYLHHILTSDDPRFAGWNKVRYAETPNPETETDPKKFLWPQRFTRDYLISKKAEMGTGAYLTEFCNDPRSDVDTMLRIDATLNEYRCDMVPQEEISPLLSKLRVDYYDCGVDGEGVLTPKEESLPFGKLASGMKRFVTVDYAPTDKATSDFSAILVLGLDSRNTLWVLDAWQGKVRPPQLIQKLWEIGQKWEVHVVGIEAVGLQRDLQQQVADSFAILSERNDWSPRVLPIVYPPKVSKQDRIASLEWRFRKGRIKLPGYMQTGAFAVLRRQIEDFTMDLSRLKHDDLVDALAMFHSLVKGAARIVDVPVKARTLQDRLADGELTFGEHSGITVLSGLMANELTDEVLANMEKARGDREPSYDDERWGGPDHTEYLENDFLW